MFSVQRVSVSYDRAGVPAPEMPAELRVYTLPHTEGISMEPERPMVIVIPGGAYQYCSDREAEPIALQFLAKGFHAAVLRYSCAPSRYPVAALELAWSIQWLRARAGELRIKKDAIGVCGFSAGGHLAGTLGTLWREPVFAAALDAAVSWRPDFQLLCYPVLTLGTFAHVGSRENLLGRPGEKDNQSERAEALSLETRVTKETPPTFLWHTAEDGAVPVENSLMYAMACRKNGVPFELHIYERGGHGLSTCTWITAAGPEQIVPEDTGWIDLAVHFVRRHGG